MKLSKKLCSGKFLLSLFNKDTQVIAILTIIGVCGTRIAWVYTAFPKNPTFKTLMLAYPLSLAITALLIFIAVYVSRPAHRFQKNSNA